MEKVIGAFANVGWAKVHPMQDSMNGNLPLKDHKSEELRDPELGPHSSQYVVHA